MYESYYRFGCAFNSLCSDIHEERIRNLREAQYESFGDRLYKKAKRRAMLDNLSNNLNSSSEIQK